MLAWPFFGKCLTHPAAIHSFFYDLMKEKENKRSRTSFCPKRLRNINLKKKKNPHIRIFLLPVFFNPLIKYDRLDD